MPDIETVLSRIESKRAEGRVVDAQTLASALRLAENRSHLERLFAAIPQTARVVERSDRFLRQGPKTHRTDDELINAAQGHLRELRSLAQRAPSPEGSTELIDAFLALPTVVINEGGHTDDAVEIQGMGREVASLPDRDGALTANDVDHLAGINAWTIRNALFSQDAATNEALEIAIELIPHHRHLAYYLISPALDDPFNFDHYYSLWDAGATLWISPEKIEVRRDTADSFLFDRYQREPVTALNLGDTDTWLRSAGDGGAEAVAVLSRCISEQAHVFDARNLGLTSLPPGVAGVSTIRFVSLEGNKFQRVPPEMFEMSWLEGLTMDDNQVQTIDPALFGALPDLEIFSFANNQIAVVPDEITTLKSLTRLNLNRNKLTALPQSMGAMTTLDSVYLHDNLLATVPAWIGQLQNLEILTLNGNPLDKLPPEILLLPDSTEISLNKTQLPDELLDADYIEDVREAWPDEWARPEGR